MAESILVHRCGRGFKSHSWHFFSLFLKLRYHTKKKAATAGNRTPINCLEGNYANHYTTVAVAETLTDIQSVSFYSCVWEQNDSGKPFKSLSGWPSGLRRQTQGYDPSTRAVTEGFLVHVCGRGFESHFWHIFFYSVLSMSMSHSRKNKTLRQRGIEPRSTAWKATMLTITPLSQLVLFCQTSCVFSFLKTHSFLICILLISHSLIQISH